MAQVSRDKLLFLREILDSGPDPSGSPLAAKLGSVRPLCMLTLNSRDICGMIV